MADNFVSPPAGRFALSAIPPTPPTDQKEATEIMKIVQNLQHQVHALIEQTLVPMVTQAEMTVDKLVAFVDEAQKRIECAVLEKSSELHRTQEILGEFQKHVVRELQG